MLFQDRSSAGISLSAKLQKFKDQKDVAVFGLARGGVVVAYEIAKELHIPLGIIIVRKVGAPGNEELALGAVTEKGEGIFNSHLINLLGVSPDYLKKQIEKEKETAKRRRQFYFKNRTPIEMAGKRVILVDDGIATGASMRVAIKTARAEGAKKIILAVPVAAPDSLDLIKKEVDEAICLSIPSYFEAVGAFYKEFDQVSDDQIIRLLEKLKSEG
ncbi:MAG: phosphoribosyltransferase [Chlamydiae bacterium]|nr:phosphoribosyltransferase [Chlamydiota bacterium]